jgi:hypothetical protein
MGSNTRNKINSAFMMEEKDQDLNKFIEDLKSKNILEKLEEKIKIVEVIIEALI